jgi:hypothetical protein
VKYSICREDSEVAFDNWKQGRYENFSRHCTTIRVSRWIGSEVRDYPIYDGTSYLCSFLVELEDKVVPETKNSCT